MKDVELKMLERAKALLESGEVARVIGWKKGEFCYDPIPAAFESVEELDSFVYNWFCLTFTVIAFIGCPNYRQSFAFNKI